MPKTSARCNAYLSAYSTNPGCWNEPRNLVSRFSKKTGILKNRPCVAIEWNPPFGDRPFCGKSAFFFQNSSKFYRIDKRAHFQNKPEFAYTSAEHRRTFSEFCGEARIIFGVQEFRETIFKNNRNLSKINRVSITLWPFRVFFEKGDPKFLSSGI